MVMIPCHLHAQHSHDPLTPQEEEHVRDLSDQPDERVKLYIKFIEQRVDAIHQTVRRPSTQHPGADIHNYLEEFTRLVDELADNFDAYEQQHVDIRKSLKVFEDHSAKWAVVLNEPTSSPEYDFARKTAIEALDSARKTATDLLKEQEQYFAKHKTPKT
jgi:chromosome segregation ATPase